MLCAAEPDPALPFDFQLGFVGYLGYEMKAEMGGRASPMIVKRNPCSLCALPSRACLLIPDCGACSQD